MNYLNYKVKHHFTREQICMMHVAVTALAVETGLDRWKILRAQLFDVLMAHDVEFCKIPYTESLRRYNNETVRPL